MTKGDFQIDVVCKTECFIGNQMAMRVEERLVLKTLPNDKLISGRYSITTTNGKLI